MNSSSEGFMTPEVDIKYKHYLVRAYLINIFKTLDGRTAFINFDRLLLLGIFGS